MTPPAPPLGVYIHWPYCAKICPYCDFNVWRARGREAEQPRLKAAILADLARQAERTGPRRLVSIFFGGGTPSLMDPDWAGEIIAACKRLWTPEPDLEISLEANPTDAEADRFAGFAAAGIDRLSLGLQALDDEALRLLGRNHNAEEARRAARLAGRIFPRLSLDLIYARPGQTVPDWTAELGEAIDLGAEHISPYQLTIEAGTAFDRAVRRGQLLPPPEDLAADLYDTTQSVLEAAGFEAYEVSNHARGRRARSRHNLVYWQGADYVGVGPGAHGRLTLDGQRHATFTLSRPQVYITQVEGSGQGLEADEILSPEAVAQERLLAGLRLLEGLAWGDVTALGLSPDHPVVHALIMQNMLVSDPKRLRSTAMGRLILDEITRKLALV